MSGEKRNPKQKNSKEEAQGANPGGDKKDAYPSPVNKSPTAKKGNPHKMDY